MLPEEIISEILSRLPTEDVLTCKLISKPWRNLIEHPSFSQKHLNHLNDFDSDHNFGKSRFIFYTRPYCYIEYDEKLNSFSRTKRINLRLPIKSYRILGSCNGLICLNAYIDSNYWQPAYVCNPITREYVVLPKFDGKNDLLTGFGYIPSTNEYKVVRICKFPIQDPKYGMIQVYTLGSGNGWRNLGKMDGNVASFGCQGVFVNGAIHWVNWNATIVAFDLMDEGFRELPSPPCEPPMVAELRVVGDFLCAFYSNDIVYDLWVLKKSESNHELFWSKEFSSIKASPITFTKSGGLLCYHYYDKNVYLYPPTSFRMLVNCGNNFTTGVCHKNTLVSLKSLGEEDTKLMDSGERARSSGECRKQRSLAIEQKKEQGL